MAKKKICGIVMPISECDGLGSTHWQDVKSIIESACSEAGFEARLVSDTFESNLIHKEILQNVYEDDIVVCDVSGRNPNVFFELGIRMATQKPTVIIKDNKTEYPFDTGPNRYVAYPRDLRHPEMEKFKSDLIAALQKTIVQTKENSFIGQLGPFQIPDVESQAVPASELIVSRLDRIERELKSGRKKTLSLARTGYHHSSGAERLAEFQGKSASLEINEVSDTQVHNGIKVYGDLYGSNAMKVVSMTRLQHRRFRLELNHSEDITEAMVDDLADCIGDAIPF